MDCEKILKSMTLEDKVTLCSGADFWHTKSMEQYDLPAIMMSDGPHGLRKQSETADMFGINESLPATCFPTAVTTACSWDEGLLYEIGEALGVEAKANGVSVVLGPGANIKRNPLCGRNFEYFSEDPYLTGKLATAHIRGTQSTGVASSLKHFAANSQEYKRLLSDSIMDERTFREIYLAGFEMAVKEGKPGTVMCAYNKINGTYCSDNKYLLSDVLRKEWGYEGLVVSDWGAMSNRIKAFEAGCDLCMPGGSAYMEKEAVQAVKDGALQEEYIDASARRVLRLVEKGIHALEKDTNSDMEAHNGLAYRAAVESAVLLKNEDRILPIKNKHKVLFVGKMAENIRYQGSGSSHINPWRLTNVSDVYNGTYLQGCDEQGDTTEELLSQIKVEAAKAEMVVVFAGLTDKYESEGFDRENMKMPAGHVQMIEAAAAVNPNIVVVLMCGSPVELPWEEKVKAILYMGLPGQNAGSAIVDLLFGKAVPSGKLAETWPVGYEDCISASFYAGERKDAHYREGIYVGYRYYTSAGKAVRYPFGYGLSYTKFKYSDIQVEGKKVHITVTNMGNCAGKEIVQLYVEPPKGEEYRPLRELKAFDKVYLEPGESKQLCFELEDRSFAVWKKGWFVPGGIYKILVGANCEELPLQANISIQEKRLSTVGTWGEQIEKEENNIKTNAVKYPDWYYTLEGIPTHEDFERLVGHEVKARSLQKGEFTMSDCVAELREYSFIMKLFYKIVCMVINNGFKGKKDNSNPEYRMMINSAVEISLSGMKINMRMKHYLIEGLLEMANGRFWKGIKTMCRKNM